MRVLRNSTAAVIIDIQERLVVHMHESDDLVINTVKLIEGLKVLQIPIILNQQYTKGLGETVKPVQLALENPEHIEKLTFSCCDEPEFITRLTNTDKKFVIVAGIETHVCVLQTVVDLIAAGFVPVVVEDCVSSRKINDKKIALKRMQNEGAIITTVESILFELLRNVKDDAFKAISKLVK
jgi:nicotinamidase-related amidase